ncbi:MAG: UDP-GlcNAc:undecaprenyl-phosphate GlcNAc-1-phosphate transferase [Psychromonas sp.]|jgi:UDP-GlcNAc:undecaprenyl-phosphate GlcNAc-1-phosphate transferase|uniref:UDP-N-acetylglucosamine--undecaprenyl-phosphate N-acetylglucosaminephosphotransferase n=1 Tax=Psychromonas sp. TaxID=1884585 RepID=UPI0039E5E444
MLTALLIAIAFISSFSAIVLLRPVAIKFGLVDKPTTRKAHTGNIPLIGGISVYIGLLIACVLVLIFSPVHAEQLMTYLLASLLMVITGALDDRYDLSVRVRITVQTVVASIMMFVAGDAIFSLGNLFALGELPLWYFAYPFTVIAVLGAINAYNMVDGIDGLIGGVSISTFITLAILFFLSDDLNEALFCVLCVAVLMPYLIYNLQLFSFCNKKIFMGDAGSMFIGLTIVWLLAIGSQPHSTDETTSFSPVVALWVIALPLMDMAAIMMRRMKKGFSPFKPDRDHLHHIFMRAGFSSRETLIIITLLSLMLSSIGVLTTVYAVPDLIQLIAFIALFLVFKKSLTHVWVLVSIYRKGKAYKRLAVRKSQDRSRVRLHKKKEKSDRAGR